MFICTAGVGIVSRGQAVVARERAGRGPGAAARARSATTVWRSCWPRGDLAIDADIVSDTAPVHELVEILLAAAPSTRWMRDATRGGVGTVCNELAKDSPFAVILDEDRIADRTAGARVRATCSGIDPLYVANEGKFRRDRPRPTRPTPRSPRCTPTHRAPRATVVGEIVPEPPGIVALRTVIRRQPDRRHARRRPAPADLLGR